MKRSLQEFRMSSLGEHEIEPHPRGAWRAFVAACVAVGLLLLGLIVGAHAATPPSVAGTPGPMAEALQHATDLAAGACGLGDLAIR
jgi:hypothetical protein